MMKFQFYTSICTALLLVSCASYTPDPVSLDRDGTEWFAVSTRLCPPNSSLSQGSMRSIGLLLNPELNRVRLSYAAETEAANYAGLWEDPSLSVEGVRVLRENFNNNSIGPALSIPVTGLPALAKQVAEQYNEADYWNVRAMERSFLSDLDVLRYNILVIHSKLKLIRERLSQVKKEKNDIDRLYKLGEVELIGLAKELDVDCLVLAGALLADVPHTRPIPVTATCEEEDLRAHLATRAKDLVVGGTAAVIDHDYVKTLFPEIGCQTDQLLLRLVRRYERYVSVSHCPPPYFSGSRSLFRIASPSVRLLYHR